MRITKPKIAVLKTDGVNCDQELLAAFSLAGSNPKLVHVNELRNGSANLKDYQLLALSGGFSYGDDVASGKILAVELLSCLRDQLEEFVSFGKPILGICNGFQVLVRTGLLPYKRLGNMDVTLTHNDSGKFQCEWTVMEVQKSRCVFTRSLQGKTITLPIAHGEGKVFGQGSVIASLEEENLIPLKYLINPNGSMNDIAGICDPSGLVFGLMPHPERFVTRYQFENWRRRVIPKPYGLSIFQDGIAYLNQS